MPRGKVLRLYYIKAKNIQSLSFSFTLIFSDNHHKTHERRGLGLLQPSTFILESLQALTSMKVQVADVSIGVWSSATAGSTFKALTSLGYFVGLHVLSQTNSHHFRILAITHPKHPSSLSPPFKLKTTPLTTHFSKVP